MKRWWMVGLLASLALNATATEISVGITRTPAGGGKNGAVVFLDQPFSTQRALQLVGSVGVVVGKGTSQDQVNRTVGVVAGGARWNFRSPWFFQFEVGAVTGHTQALSSTWQFVSSLGWHHGPAVVQIRHISNGGTQGRNAGETMLLFGWSF